ncbi:hypothetical protein BCR41DRAFT_372793 [Lobosporangium transversale]|uniref:Uncharacterized protein n=1 Tax=Lobosporangium transversale TaxID=64571 RepID=A0A1Y2GI77_9FUNG|nr:hypothetical protein BCR41DRAFT_372793 [Lobosporangium transversale]ORZ09765.1 hypothetical protein BCR41DRAFT_372793 [Lobosporangium transversale]|eukprot:XP_021879035.1 hypothetical protein BCR41DRAFT_372793 [Lobosporangium transversale]
MKGWIRLLTGYQFMTTGRDLALKQQWEIEQKNIRLMRAPPRVTGFEKMKDNWEDARFIWPTNINSSSRFDHGEVHYSRLVEGQSGRGECLQCYRYVLEMEEEGGEEEEEERGGGGGGRLQYGLKLVVTRGIDYLDPHVEFHRCRFWLVHTAMDCAQIFTTKYHFIPWTMPRRFPSTLQELPGQNLNQVEPDIQAIPPLSLRPKTTWIAIRRMLGVNVMERCWRDRSVFIGP